MYKIVRSPRAWWPVTWSGVGEDGEIVENRIEMRFRILKVDDFVVLMQEAAAVQDAAGAAPASEAEQKRTSAVFAEVVERIAEDWRGVAAENGEPLTWSRDNLALLMNEPRVFDRTLAAFKEVTAGGPEIRAGN